MSDAANRAAAAIWGMFAADSLALGAHWVYDVSAIAESLGRPETLSAPITERFHKNRTAGDFTHYGDQALILLQSIAAQKRFDVDDYLTRWKELFTHYDGYIDGATRTTLGRLEFGEGPDSCGSNSTDLAGASRFAPLLAAYHSDVDALTAAARSQTKMTHNSPLVLDAAEFFARVAHAAVNGTKLEDAISKALSADYSAPISDWLKDSREATPLDVTAAIAKFGQSCGVEGAFRGTMQILLKYPDDPEEALVQNVMAGGDSAARGMLLGTLYGAAGGQTAIPDRWTDDINASADISRLLDGFA